jgi:hypothetical protein
MNNTFAFLKTIALGLMLFSNAVVAGEPTPGDTGPPRPEYLMRRMRGMSGMMPGGRDSVLSHMKNTIKLEVAEDF